MSDCSSTTHTAKFTIGEVVRQFGQAYVNTYQPAYRTVKILRNMGNCRTAALGGHLVSCSACGYQKKVYNSCGDGNCPQCQNIKKQLWIDKMVHHLLPTKHYHVIFTLPHELNDLIFHNQKLLYDLLFKSAWQSIEKVVGQGQTGMVATLHTWGSNLSFHPHLHCIVPDGKLLDKQWLRVSASNQRCYCNAKELRKTFKEVFLANLVSVLEKSDVYLTDQGNAPADSIYLDRLVKKITRKKWCIRIESPVLGVEQIVEYLGRYIKRVAITNSRIQAITDKEVHFSHKVYRKQKKGKAAPVTTLAMNGVTFLQRFVQHLLPAYYHRVHYYGLYSFAAKKRKAIAYTLLTQASLTPYQPPLKRQLLERMLGIDPDVCPDCACYATLTSTPIVADSTRYFSFSNYWQQSPIIRAKRAPPVAYQKVG